MQIRILVRTAIDGVEYAPNDVVDCSEAVGNAAVKGLVASSGPKDIAAGLAESGEPIEHKPAHPENKAPEKAVDPRAAAAKR